MITWARSLRRRVLVTEGAGNVANGDDWIAGTRETGAPVRPRTLRRGASEWLAIVGVLLLVAVGAAAAATGGFKRSTRTSTTTTASTPRPVGTLAISDVSVTTHASTAVVRWSTSVPAKSYLAFRLGSLGLTASTRSRAGVTHVGVLRGLKKNTIYHLWIVATRGAHTIRKQTIVALPHQ
jgi:hypothetical protein